MKIPASEIERAAGKGDIRTYLNHVYLDREKCVLVATNGHILARIQLQEDDFVEEDATGFVTEEALKAARKVKDTYGPNRLKANGGLEVLFGATFPRPKIDDLGKFPDWDRVIPKMDQLPGKTLTFNVDLLSNLAKAISDKGSNIITLHLPWDAGHAILVTPDMGETEGRVGVLMPARGKHNSGPLFEKPKAPTVPTPAEIDASARKQWKVAWRRARAWMKQGTAKPRNRTEELACACRMSRNRVGYIAVSVHGVWLAQRIAG